MWVQGKSGTETYRWFPADYSDDDLKDEAEEWAGGTSQGMLNDRYRFGFDRVKKLPVKVKENLVVEWANRLNNAKTMLEILASTEIIIP
jgi:hypothetical protein